MERLSAPARTREELRALMSGDLGTAAGRGDLVRLALRRRCHTNLDRRGAGFGRRADLRPLWRLATSGTLRLLGREAYGGK
jgi:hypothetical protein